MIFRRLPPNALSPDAKYEKVMEAFGGHGYYVETPAHLEQILEKSLTVHANEPVLINVAVSSVAGRKQQVIKDKQWFPCMKGNKLIDLGSFIVMEPLTSRSTNISVTSFLNL